MANKIVDLKIPFDASFEQIFARKFPRATDYQIIRKSLDARGASRGRLPAYTYRVEYVEKGKIISSTTQYPQIDPERAIRPVIIGMGPAGLFCALYFLKHGIKPVLIEQGEQISARMKSIALYWKRGQFNPNSNVCYGEGGAGLFSDGKLNTRIKSPFTKEVMQSFVDFGAPEETAYLADPHLGSNLIRKVLLKITAFLEQEGCELKYNCSLVDFDFKDSSVQSARLSNGELLVGDHFILATGHSPHQLYKKLFDKMRLPITAKDFAVGFRIEHARPLIDNGQYGRFAQAGLGSARYKLKYYEPSTDSACYSFCMCPGGYVLSSGTEEQGLVTNGMSNWNKSSPWSNAAMVTPVKAGIDFGNGPFDGFTWRDQIEQNAYQMSLKYADGKKLPYATISEFLERQLNPDAPVPKTHSCPSGIIKAPIWELYSDQINQRIEAGLRQFEKQIPGFCHGPGILIAPETRTSSPIVLKRDRESLNIPDFPNFYPCGEGAGAAGGIVSAAVDGIKVAHNIIHLVKQSIN
jgi:uncharacterized FAD-dependent dehydrogenase